MCMEVETKTNCLNFWKRKERSIMTIHILTLMKNTKWFRFPSPLVLSNKGNQLMNIFYESIFSGLWVFNYWFNFCFPFSHHSSVMETQTIPFLRGQPFLFLYHVEPCSLSFMYCCIVFQLSLCLFIFIVYSPCPSNSKSPFFLRFKASASGDSNAEKRMYAKTMSGDKAKIIWVNIFLFWFK